MRLYRLVTEFPSNFPFAVRRVYAFNTHIIPEPAVAKIRLSNPAVYCVEFILAEHNPARNKAVVHHIFRYVDSCPLYFAELECHIQEIEKRACQHSNKNQRQNAQCRGKYEYRVKKAFHNAPHSACRIPYYKHIRLCCVACHIIPIPCV